MINQLVIVGMLEKIGYPADVSENGIEALKKIEQYPYQLVFMDCLMPEMDGFDTTKQIREREEKDPSIKKVYIIALTAKAMKGDREHCLKTGMDDFLEKPIKMGDLKIVLDKYLR